MDKLPIFTDKIYRAQCPKKILKDIQSSLVTLSWRNNAANSTSQDNRLHQQTQYKQLVKWIDEKLISVKQDLGLQCDRIAISSMWANCNLLNQWHHGHVHRNSLVSGLIYLSDSSAETWFSKYSFWKQDSFMYLFPEEEKILNTYKHRTNKGEMLIFPSSLYHSVTEHKETHPRYSLSFNCFPEGAIGHDYEHLNLKVL